MMEYHLNLDPDTSFMCLEWNLGEPCEWNLGDCKKMVFKRIMPGDIVINDPKEFVSFANEIATIKSL